MSSKIDSTVPKYRHHKGTNQAFVQIKGHRHYLGKWNTQASKERYARFVAELAISSAASEALPAATPVSQLTVVELVADYLDYAQGYYQKNGLEMNVLFDTDFREQKCLTDIQHIQTIIVDFKTY